jgi:hypothetical protein
MRGSAVGPTAVGQLISVVAVVVGVALLSTPVDAQATTTANATSCLDRGSPTYLDCCHEYGISMKPYWLLALQPVLLTLLTDILPAVVVGTEKDPSTATFIFVVVIVTAQVALALYGGYEIIQARPSGGWRHYMGTVFLVFNSSVGITAASFVARSMTLFTLADFAQEITADRRLFVFASGCLAVVVFSGYGLAGVVTHSIPALFTFAPLAVAAVLGGFVFGLPFLLLERFDMHATATMARTTVSFGFFYMFLYVVGPSLWFQFNDGASWTEAIEADARARSTTTFMACAREQFAAVRSGRGGSAAADWVRIFF